MLTRIKTIMKNVPLLLEAPCKSVTQNPKNDESKNKKKRQLSL
jgi:hypothetical protein